MSFREVTVEYVCNSLSASNVTMPALASFGQISPFIPALSARVFKNVSVLVAGRHHDTFLADSTGWQVGVTLDGGTAHIYRNTNTYTSMGEHIWWYASQDITDQWQAAWSSTTKETGTVNVSFAHHGAAWAMGNFQAKLFITYEYDDLEMPLSGTLLKTVKVPIESKTAVLTTTVEELGGAGSWSIPPLDTFLPESGKTIEDAWIEVFSSDASTAASAFGLRWTWNGAAENNVFAQNQDTNISLTNWYIIKLKHAGGTFPSDIPPRMLVRGSDVVTSRYNTCGGFLGVTYRYSANSDRVLNSLMMPLGGDGGYVGSGSQGFSRNEATLNIQEPGPITVKNSGFMVSCLDSANVTLNLRMGSAIAGTLSESQQSWRTYTITAGTLTAGSHIVTQRADSGSLAGTGLVLDRGENRVWVDWWSTAATGSNGAGSNASAIVLINYESSCSNSGAAAHNHTTWWTCVSGTTTQSGFFGTDNSHLKIPRWVHPPTLSGSAWFLNNAGFWMQNLSFFGNTGISLHTENDDLANTFVPVMDSIVLGEAEHTTHFCFPRATPLFWRHRQEPLTGSLFDPRKPRQFKIISQCLSWHNLWFLMTYHNIGFPVTASVKHYRDSAQGIGVSVHRHLDKVLMHQVTASASGQYSFLAYDNVSPLYAHATQSIYHVGTSETSAPSTIPSS